jgi:hypothetical protein
VNTQAQRVALWNSLKPFLQSGECPPGFPKETFGELHRIYANGDLWAGEAPTASLADRMRSFTTSTRVDQLLWQVLQAVEELRGTNSPSTISLKAR